MMLTTLLLLAAPAANAQALTLSPSAVLLGNHGGIRPGLRMGYEPAPPIALELVGDYGPFGFDAGASITGRGWLVGEGDTGVFLFGRGNIGIASFGEETNLGSWVGLYGGFGGRPAEWLNLEASVGPEWVAMGDVRLRTELTVGLVFNLGAGSGSTRHKPVREVN